MKRYFVTGGTGFFGKSILDYLKRNPAVLPDVEWTFLSRDPDRFRAQNVALLDQPRAFAFCQGDVRDFELPDRDARYDVVLHAATAAVTSLADAEMTSTIVDGTRHVIDFARATGVSRILFTSSGAVYGPQTEAVSEDAPCRPVTAYGRGKLLAERMLCESGLEVKVARCFAFVGQHLRRDIHYAIGNFIRDCLAGVPIVIQGDGTPLRSYLHADDLVEWLLTVLGRGIPGRPYNVGSPEGMSVLDVARRVRAALGTANEICVRGVPTGAPPSVYVPTTARAERELGLTCRIGFDDAVRRSAMI